MQASKLARRTNRFHSATAKVARAAVFALSCAVVLACTAVAEACPTCKYALGSGEDHFINAWALSIVFMLMMPFLIAGSLSAYMYYLVRCARAEQAAKQAAAEAAGGVPFEAGRNAEAREHETAGV
jgi:hypothetical protein